MERKIKACIEFTVSKTIEISVDDLKAFYNKYNRTEKYGSLEELVEDYVYQDGSDFYVDNFDEIGEELVDLDIYEVVDVDENDDEVEVEGEFSLEKLIESKLNNIEMCKLEKELDELVWADDVDESEYKFKIKRKEK